MNNQRVGQAVSFDIAIDKRNRQGGQSADVVRCWVAQVFVLRPPHGATAGALQQELAPVDTVRTAIAAIAVLEAPP